MQSNVTKEEWVDMFREIGLSEDLMMEWHRLFEARHPEGHGGFLEWLGVAPDEITRIRESCRE